MRPFPGKPYPAAAHSASTIQWGLWQIVLGFIVFGILAVVAGRLMMDGPSSSTQVGPKGICLCPSCDSNYRALNLQGKPFADFPQHVLLSRVTFWRHKRAALADGFSDVEPWWVWLDKAGNQVYQPVNRTTYQQLGEDPMDVAREDDAPGEPKFAQGAHLLLADIAGCTAVVVGCCLSLNIL